jgi:hypothetical protein
MELKPGHRLEEIVYYCEERKQLFKRKAVIDDELEIRRKLCGTVLILKVAWNGHKNLMVKTINGQAARFVGTGSKSLPAYLHGTEHTSARRTTENLWDLTREAYGIKQLEIA